MNKCEKCGFLHWRTDPCREPKKSTAEMKESPSTEPHRKSLSQGRVSSSIGGLEGRMASAPDAPAGTQAPSVDTKFNKQAWQRAYMREYRKGMRRTNVKIEELKAEEMARARLLALAPVLLEALSDLLDKYVAVLRSGDCGNCDPESEEEVIAAREAIAQATGEDK